MTTHKGVFYFRSYHRAREFANKANLVERGWSEDRRIIRYDLGWAIQKCFSGPYWGPNGWDE